MRRMRYVDARGVERVLWFAQWVYLDTAARKGGFEQGWGGLGNTLTVRLLRERGLLMLDDRTRPWRVTGSTRLGERVLAEWDRRAGGGGG